jgi:hypothetical protein
MHSSIEDFLANLKAGDVFLFHWKITTEQKHYQVILNKSIKPDTKLIFASVATSQIKKRIDFITKKWLHPDTLVIIKSGEVAFLKLDSCFNCNEPMVYDQFSLFGDYLSGALIPQWRLSSEILEKIYNWIELSDMVSEKNKKIIREL